MFERQGKEHFAVVSSSFADVFDKNYFVVSIFFVASKKIWISKIDERDISTSFKNNVILLRMYEYGHIQKH